MLVFPHVLPFGRGGPIHTSGPAWLATGGVGQWTQIAGTTAPAELGDYCGMGLRETGGYVQLFSGASGGHGGNLTNNEVLTLDLTLDSPSWVTARSGSSATGWDTTGASNLNAEYFSDGRPVPRHTYWDVNWSSTLNRYLVGGRFWGSGAYDSTQFDGFNPSTNDWDAAGTYGARASGAIFLGCRNPATDVLYSVQGYIFTPGSGWSTYTQSGVILNRGGYAYDTTRNFIYGLSSGDNFSAGSSTIVSAKLNPSTGVGTAITFNSSSAWTSFQANASSFLCSNIVYDPDLDKYYFYNGGTTEGTQTIYVVTPNSTTTWDMSVMSVSGVTPAASSSGVMTKFRYISKYKVGVLVVSGQSVYAIRTQ